VPAAELKAGSLFFSVLAERIKGRLHRVFGRDGSPR
jgi:hypothetical protein